MSLPICDFAGGAVEGSSLGVVGALLGTSARRVARVLRRRRLVLLLLLLGDPSLEELRCLTVVNCGCCVCCCVNGRSALRFECDLPLRFLLAPETPDSSNSRDSDSTSSRCRMPDRRMAEAPAAKRCGCLFFQGPLRPFLASCSHTALLREKRAPPRSAIPYPYPSQDLHTSAFSTSAFMCSCRASTRPKERGV